MKKKRNKNFFSPHFCLEVYGDIFRCNRSCWEFGEASMVAICHKTLKSAISVYLFPFFLLILTTFFPIFKNFPWILSFTFLSNSDCTSGTFQILFKTLTPRQFKTASVTSHDLMSTNLPWKKTLLQWLFHYKPSCRVLQWEKRSIPSDLELGVAPICRIIDEGCLARRHTTCLPPADHSRPICYQTLLYKPTF